MSKVVSLRLKDEQFGRLQRAARSLGRRPSEAAALLLEEALREREFAFIEFRDSAFGRQAYLKNTRLAVWHVADAARSLGSDAAQIADYYEIPVVQAQAMLNYAAAYPDEIQAAIADNDSVTEEDLRRLLPNLQVIRV
jgi:uncharacterized protein (DUF433 family)